MISATIATTELKFKIAVRGRGRLVTDRRGVAIRSVPLSTAEYSAVVFVAIFAMRPKFKQFEVRAFSSLRMLSDDPRQPAHFFDTERIVTDRREAASYKSRNEFQEQNETT